MTTDLRTIDTFTGCTRRDLRTLDAQSTRLHYGAGTTISRDGDNGQQIVVVCAGNVVVDRNGDAMATANPGDVIAKLTPTGAVPTSPTTLHALTDCDLLVVDRREFTALELDAPAVARRIRAAAKQPAPTVAVPAMARLAASR
jgi:CRP-like cAMP-binding protein